MEYSDSHCHLDSYSREELDFVLDQMREKGIDLALSVSLNLETSQNVIEIAQSNARVKAAIGIHPNRVKPLSSKERDVFCELCENKNVVAIGEIGLDYNCPTSREDQKELFGYQLSVAKDANLPVNIHYSSDAYKDLFNIIKKNGISGLKGICHGFVGNIKQLHDWLDLGFYISLGELSLGIAKDPPMLVNELSNEIIRQIPIDRLLVETDSMARISVSRWKDIFENIHIPPAGLKEDEPFRQPSDVVEVVEAVADKRGMSIEELATKTTDNLNRLLKLKSSD